jgi:NitT/TauT family transport system ATP-binding protein
MIEIEGLSKSFGGTSSSAPVVQVLDGIDATVGKSELVGILGPSGCGKTTLLELIAGLQKPTSGRVTVNGRQVTGPSREVGVVFQEESTFPWRTVEKNISFGLQMMGLRGEELRRRRDEGISLVGLEAFRKFYPRQLSGGMKQRVAVARTLVTRPSVIVLDEPFGALDEQTRLVLGLELRRILKETDSAGILVTHSIQEAALLCDRVVVLSARPTTVVTVIESDLGAERNSQMLGSNEFAAISQTLWSLMTGPRMGAVTANDET